LLVVFVSIVLHLVLQPFDISRPKTRLLHNLEFAGLTVCFLTFWGGLLFYLGYEDPGSVSEEFLWLMSFFIVVTNVLYLAGTVFKFVVEFIHDYKHKAKMKRETRMDVDATQVVPAGETFNNEEEEIYRSTIKTVETLESQYRVHELGFRNKQKRRTNLHRANLQLRILARAKAKRTKALAKVPLFADLDMDAHHVLLEAMTFQKRSEGDVLCRQGDTAEEFYIMIKGKCSVTVCRDDNDLMNGIKVAALKPLDFFGESALMSAEEAGEDEEEDGQVRMATVAVESETAEFLKLHRLKFDELVRKGTLKAKTTDTALEVRQRRHEENCKSFNASAAVGQPQPPKPPLGPPPKSS
jgi:hypothetical protein